MALTSRLAVLVFAALPIGVAAADNNYFGVLRLPSNALPPAGSFSFQSSPVNAFSPWRSDSLWQADSGRRMKLGYNYTRYLAFESEFVDMGRAPNDVFANPSNLATAFRSTGFGVDTVATLPVWRSLSFYGRFGAYRGDPRNTFATYSTSLLADPTRGTRWRYGLGVRYDFNSALGVHADIERYSPMGAPLGEPDSDQISIGVNWRF
ncbi:MAG TPA: outer membrane beta-barrel protein [Usitatibacter sp.]|nr:outer membrane beta-barrel protein [Usitatibacter sp.]